MINPNEIVPVTKIDLLSLYYLILSGNSDNEGMGAIYGENGIGGKFSVSLANSICFCAAPAETIDFASGATGAKVYFVPDYNYSGITVDGVQVETTGAVVNPNGADLYLAEIGSGTMTIYQITPSFGD